MKIFVTHSSSFDFEGELYAPLRGSALAGKHQFIFPHENGSEENTRDIIRGCDVVFAEVSYPSTGSGIELGWADSFQKPIVCVYKNGSTPSAALLGVVKALFPYSTAVDLLEKLESELEKLS
jgi:nucleoside 2-deoxyribosyltransferase